jgi:hypothetical protein
MGLQGQPLKRLPIVIHNVIRYTGGEGRLFDQLMLRLVGYSVLTPLGFLVLQMRKSAP